MGSWLALPLPQGGDSPQLQQVQIWLQGHQEGSPHPAGWDWVGLQRLRGYVPPWAGTIAVILQI